MVSQLKDIAKLVVPLALAVLVIRAAMDGWRMRSIPAGGVLLHKESGAGDRAYLSNPWSQV